MGGHTEPAGTGRTEPAGTVRTGPDPAGPAEEDVVDLIEDVSIDGMCGVY